MLQSKLGTGTTLLRSKLVALLAGVAFFAVNTVAAFAQQPAHRPVAKPTCNCRPVTSQLYRRH
jgi:hypothetical protein